MEMAQRTDDAFLFDVSRDEIGRVFQSFHRVAHRHADTSFAKHIQIVEAVAKRDRLRRLGAK